MSESHKIFGLEVKSLDPEDVPLECIVILKVMCGDEGTGTVVRRSRGLNMVEEIGMLSLALDNSQAQARSAWRPDTDTWDDG